MTTNQAIGVGEWVHIPSTAPAEPAADTSEALHEAAISHFDAHRAQLQRAGLARTVAPVKAPSRVYHLLKRTFDIVVATALLVATLPLSLTIAALIKLHDRGPVFFMQERTGRGGERFRMIKFRTMVTNAEELKSQLRHLSTVAWPDFKMDKDPRITPIGRVLRATYLDEIPQLVNVIRGQMSLVGPRPTSFHASTYSPWHTERLDATPGITGLWQVKRGSNETSFDDRLRLDVHYIRNRTVVGDLRILLGTFTSSLRRSGK
jgi:lipopolysaccharide/colanic/teichoic acid biosynthesis glycosyltransferase